METIIIGVISIFFLVVFLVVFIGKSLTTYVSVKASPESILLNNTKVLNTFQKKNNIQMPIYYINLNRSTDRKKYMEEMFLNFQIQNYTRIEAVDYKYISKKDKILTLGRDNHVIPIKTKGNINLDAKLACTLSHVKLIKSAYEKGEEKILVLEDDASILLTSLLNKTLEKHLEVLPKDWEICPVGYKHSGIKEEDDNSYTKLQKTYGLQISGTFGYIINRQGMEKIVNLHKDSYDFMKEDSRTIVADNYLYRQCQTYTLNNVFVFPYNLELHTTVQSDSHEINHIKTANNIIKKFVNNMSCFDFIDKIYYINLDSRTDRKELLEKQFQKFIKEGLLTEDKVERISAVATPGQGWKGCGMSHINALQKAQDNGYNNVLILEDDILFKKDPKSVSKILKNAIWHNNNYDVLLLSAIALNKKPHDIYVDRITKAYTTSSYLITKNMIPVLKDNFQSCIDKINDTGKRYNIDEEWHSLQPAYNWFIIRDSIATQYPSFSDIDNKEVDPRNRVKSLIEKNKSKNIF